MNGFQLEEAIGAQKTTNAQSFLAINFITSIVQTINKLLSWAGV